MAESNKNKNIDQNNKLQKQATKNTAELSHDSLIQSDVSIHTCIEHVIEASDNENLIFKDPINPDAEIQSNEVVQIDMQAISNNYVQTMLTKIEQELIRDKKIDEKSNKEGVSKDEN